ncbi:MAG: DUF5119 domain-containing protein [Prevotella sp.]|nr:DUF5119 domain-containing protein [Prevotella sp.]
MTRFRPAAARCARRGLALLCGLLLLAACERRPLEAIVNETVRVQLVVNWDDYFTPLYGEHPNGMTVMVWGSHAARPIVESVNGTTLTLHLVPDVYRLVVFNDREDEFLPYMRLRDATSFSDVTMRLQHYDHTTRDNETNDYVHYPEPIGVAVDTFEISEAMVLRDTTIFVPYKDYLSNGQQLYHDNDYVYQIDEVGMPMTVNLYLEAKVKRYQSIQTVEASLSGLADGFYLSRVDRTAEAGTIILNPNTWRFRKYGDTPDSLGIISNETMCFGLPYGKETLAERSEADNVLSFVITLTDGTVLRQSFEVGKDLHYITPEGIEVQIRYREDLRNILLKLDLSEVIVMPPVPDQRVGAGFDAEVRDWEDGGIIDLGGF